MKRSIPIGELEAAGNRVVGKAYLAGNLGERARLRTLPRDPEKTRKILEIGLKRIKEHPMRRLPDGGLFIPGISDSSD